MQVVRTCPHIGKNQSPEVDDGQAVRVDRTACLFRHEVVHHAQKACSQEETYGIVTIPPLNHGIDCARINRIGFHEARRNAQVIDDVQQGNGQNETAVEPVGNVDVFDFTFGNRTEEYDGVSNPNQSDQDVDRPFQFSIFFSLGITQRQADDCANDNRLPTPEGKCRQPSAKQACITGTLNNVV